MALGTVTVLERSQFPGPLRMDLLSFPADGAYPTGGSAGFQATVRNALDVGNLEVIAVLPQDCGGYVVSHDKANDKLKVYHGNNDGGADGPAVEVGAAANLSSTTFVVLVVSK